jgi:hypothetical protein
MAFNLGGLLRTGLSVAEGGPLAALMGQNPFSMILQAFVKKNLGRGSGGAGVADMIGAGAGVAGGNPSFANVLGGPPSGMVDALREGPMGTLAEDWGADSTGGAATTAGGGPIGPGGNNPGIAGKGAAQPAKNMNPILKSFLDSYFNQRTAKTQPQQYQAATFTHSGGRAAMPTYAGY